MMPHPHRLAVVILPLALLLCAPANADGVELEPFVRQYDADYDDVQRFYNLPWSEVAFDRKEKLLDEWQTKLAAVKFDELSQQGRIDYLLVRNHIDHERSSLKLSRRALAEITPLLPFRSDYLALGAKHYAMEPVDPRSAAETLAKVPDAVKAVRERCEKGRAAASALTTRPTEAVANICDDAGHELLAVSPVAARRASRAVDALRWSLREWYDFYSGYHPEFTFWVRKPYDDAGAALDEYSRFLREEIAGQRGKDDDPLVGDPIGAEAIDADLRNEMMPYSPEELIRIGEREFAWCEVEMKKAAAEMGFADDWKKALEKVKSNITPPGQQDQLCKQQSRDAIKFVTDRNLVTIPPLADELWRLTRITPEVQRVLPFAAYGGQNMMVSSPSEAMKNADKLMSMRGNNRHFNHIVTPHELIPGHHLQAFMAQRERPYRGKFSTPFYIEGWCLHWEMLLWDLGYGATPEDRVGMLFWRMHRCARIIVSLKFQLGQMQPAEMVEFLIDRVGHEPFTATSEVRRFIGGDYSPLYQVGYMIGGLQIRALHKQLVGGKKMSDREFHDFILKQGPIPIELIRAAMLNEPLMRETQPAWRFAD